MSEITGTIKDDRTGTVKNTAVGLPDKLNCDVGSDFVHRIVTFVH